MKYSGYFLFLLSILISYSLKKYDKDYFQSIIDFHHAEYEFHRANHQYSKLYEISKIKPNWPEMDSILHEFKMAIYDHNWAEENRNRALNYLEMNNIQYNQYQSSLSLFSKYVEFLLNKFYFIATNDEPITVIVDSIQVLNNNIQADFHCFYNLNYYPNISFYLNNELTDLSCININDAVQRNVKVIYYDSYFGTKIIYK